MQDRETLIIKIKDSKVLKLIYDLEDLNLIEIVGSDIKKPAKKLSELLSSSLSPEQAEKMHEELKQMRG